MLKWPAIVNAPNKLLKESFSIIYNGAIAPVIIIGLLRFSREKLKKEAVYAMVSVPWITMKLS